MPCVCTRACMSVCVTVPVKLHLIQILYACIRFVVMIYNRLEDCGTIGYLQICWMPCVGSHLLHCDPFLPQEQYAFIHDALCDYLTCGDTSVVAHNLQVHIRKLSTRGTSSSVTGFEEEMKVSPSIVPCSGLL